MNASAGLALHARAEIAPTLLRFITCGSVDDGKSTLIGRLLFDASPIPEDLLATLAADSKRYGTQGARIDYSLLVDGLSAEREQGITIDVAYRYFATARRSFIVADTPGHEQYTRNMATGASTADLAVLVVDARKGVLPQTRRHSLIVSMLRVRHVAVAVNKMDLVDYAPEVFARIEREYRAFAAALGFSSIVVIPISALEGDNIAVHSPRMPFYAGPTLVEHLETVDASSGEAAGPFRMPVQWVNRPSPEFRGFAGLVAGGAIAVGEAVRVLPSGRETRVAAILGPNGPLAEGGAGQSITLTLADEVDASRGDVITAAGAPATIATRIKSKLLWVAEDAMRPGRAYLLKIGARLVGATPMAPSAVIDIETGDPSASAAPLALNAIGLVEIALDRAIVFDPYAVNRETGGFILIDRVTNATIAMGLIEGAAPMPSLDALATDASYLGMEGLLSDGSVPVAGPVAAAVADPPAVPAHAPAAEPTDATSAWLVADGVTNFVIAYAFTRDFELAFAFCAASFAAKMALKSIVARLR